jgi:hypothetical protein
MSEPAWVPLGAAPAGPQTIFPIDFRNPSVASFPGNVYPGVNALTVWEEWAWNFIDSGWGYLYGIVRIPESAVVVTPKILLELAAANAGNAQVHVAWERIAAGASLNFAGFDASNSVAVTLAAGRARYAHSVAMTAAPPAAGDLIVVQIGRDGGNAADTLVGPLELLSGYLSLV